MVQENKLRRKDLKKPDQFQIVSGDLLGFISQYKNLIISLVIGILLLGGGLLFASNQKKAQTLRMESFYYQMNLKVAESNGEFDEKLVSDLKSILEKIKEGPQKLRAELLLADIYYQNRKFDDAIVLFQSVLDKSQPEDMVSFLAQSGLAHSYEGKKDYNSAISHYKKIINRPEKFPLFYTYLGLSRCYELVQDSKNAILILREMQTKFPEHADLERVPLALKRLEGKA